MRIKWIDYCKAIAIIAMIYDHVALVVHFQKCTIRRIYTFMAHAHFFLFIGSCFERREISKMGKFQAISEK